MPNKQSFRRFWLPKIAFLTYGLYVLLALWGGLSFSAKTALLETQLICRHDAVESCSKTEIYLWHHAKTEMPLRLVTAVESQRFRTSSSSESANFEIVLKMGAADFSLETVSSQVAEDRIKLYHRFLKDKSAAPIIYQVSEGYELFFLTWLIASLILGLGLLPLIAIFWVLRPKSEPGVDSNPDSNLA